MIQIEKFALGRAASDGEFLDLNHTSGANKTAMSVKIRYFAWVREKTGKAEEVVDLPAGVATVADLVAWLTQRGPEYAEAFARPGVVRAAVDQTHVQQTASVVGAREIAFFPPVTGG